MPNEDRSVTREWKWMLPCGRKYNRLKPHGHINHIRKTKQKQVGEKQQKRGISHGLSQTRSEWWWGDWRSRCPDSFTLVFEDEASCHGDTSPSSRTPTNPLIYSCDVSSPDQSTGSVLWTRLRGSVQHLRRASSSCLSGLVWLRTQTGCTQLWSQPSQATTSHVGAHCPVRMFLPPLATMRPRRPSLSFHWLLSSVVMPCDSAWAGTLSQSASLYPRGWST